MSDDMLTQDEINELLGMSVGGSGGAPPAPSGNSVSATPPSPPHAGSSGSHQSGGPFVLEGTDSELFQKVSSTSAKALDHIMSSMLGSQPVEVKVESIVGMTYGDLMQIYPEETVVVAELEYVTGVMGKTLVIFKKETACSIGDIMLSGTGEGLTELEELHYSALQEMMNLLNGKNSTELSTMLKGKAVDIGPPRIIQECFTEPTGTLSEWDPSEPVVRVALNLKIGTVVDSFLSQIYSGKLAESLLEVLRAQFAKSMTPTGPKQAPPPPQQAMHQPHQGPMDQVPVMVGAPQYPGMQQGQGGYPPQMQGDWQQPGYPPYNQNFNLNQGGPQMGGPQMGGHPPMGGPQMGGGYGPPGGGMPPYNAAPADFGYNVMGPGFGGGFGAGSNIELLLDIPLQVTVELGRTTMEIREILEIGIGSVIELKKLAGEPVEMFVNNKLIAKGEVVVIDENFSIRLTSIVSPEERLESLK